MSATKAMVEFRNKIAEIYLNSVKSSGRDGVSIEDIVRLVENDLKIDIESLKNEIVKITLRSFVFSVGRRKKPNSSDNESTTLFEEYKRIPHGLRIGNGKFKPTANTTLSEVRNYLKEHTRRSKESLIELKRLISDLEKFKESEDDSLETLMKRRNKTML